MLKNRKLKVLFLNDFQHLPWFILLSGSAFNLELMMARNRGSTPPGKVTRLRQIQYQVQPVSISYLFITKIYLNFKSNRNMKLNFLTLRGC